MVNLRQQLSDLFEGVFPNLGGRKTHLAFSICIEGPQIEFWVHYALSEDNVRSHYMNIFRTCYRCRLNNTSTTNLEDLYFSRRY